MFALEAKGIRKTYGGVVALHGADFSLKPGSVHALLGENGAGKSTLVKIMTGAIRPDAGSLNLEGRAVSFGSTADAVSSGVAVVAQELSLFPHLDVLSNMFPMREPRRGPFVDRTKMRELAVPVLEALGFNHGLHTPVAHLSLADRQLLEIAKALATNPRVLLLDEPTSALETGASDRLLGVLRVLRERNVAVVYVSHILEEVMSLCDEVTVLRDGHVALASSPIATLSMDKIVATMLGKPHESPASTPGNKPAAPTSKDAEAALIVSNLSTASGLHGVDFTVGKGEIVGLAGLAGSGPQEVLAAIAGLTKTVGGRITLPAGKPSATSLRQAIDRGVAFVSGDRRRLGLMLDKPIWENIVQVQSIGMARDGALLRSASLQARAAALAASVGVKAPSVHLDAGALSGGNQQKVVLAKWLDTHPSIMLLDDPTRGVDIGAREEINALLRQAARDGMVALYLSTDLEELARGCDRVLVFYRGTICGELSGSALTSRALLELMNTGGVDQDAA